MKYAVAGLAIVAAIAALFFRPPHAADVGVGVGSVRASPDLFRHSSGREVRPPARRVVVYVAGEVEKPGVYAMAPDARANDALARAGGAKSDADLVAVNLAAPLHDGDEVAVPKVGAAHPRATRRSAPRSRASRAPRSHDRRRVAAEPDRPLEEIDLNTADEATLERLPGVGPGLAARIVAYRETNGPFETVDELADVSGVSPHLIDLMTGAGITARGGVSKPNGSGL